MRMDAGDDQIHLLEHGIGEIECAIGQNIDLDSGEDANAVDLLVSGADALDVLHGALIIEPVGECQILRMICDGHVFISVGAGGLGHFFDRVSAIGFDGVHVDVAL